MKFADRHAQVEADPVKELLRRRQMWAMCPPEPGEENLKPAAQIVPCDTINAAIAELIEHRVRIGHPTARDLYNEFYDMDC